MRDAGIRRLLDVRLHNSSQLSGFAKRDDLPFFLAELCGAKYLHEPLLAPTREMLDAYRGGRMDWPEYQERFLDLLHERRVEDALDADLFSVPTVLLCSEASPERCHRRLVVEYLDREWGGLRAVHL